MGHHAHDGVDVMCMPPFPGALYKTVSRDRNNVDDVVAVQPSRPRYGRHGGVLSVSGRAIVGSRLVGAVGSRLVGAAGRGAGRVVSRSGQSDKGPPGRPEQSD